MIAINMPDGAIFIKRGTMKIDVASYIGRDCVASHKYGILPWRSIQTTWYLEMFSQERISFRLGKKTPYIMMNITKLKGTAINFQRYESVDKSLYVSEAGKRAFGIGMIYLRRIWILGLFRHGKIVFAMNGALPDVFVNGKALNYASRHNISEYGQSNFGEHWRIITNVWLQGIALIQKAISLVLVVKVEEHLKFETSNGHTLEFPITEHTPAYYDYLVEHLYDLSCKSGLYFAHRCHKIPRADTSLSLMHRYTPEATVLFSIVIPMIKKETEAFRKKLVAILIYHVIPDISEMISRFVLN
jgi:hypothetical protein